MSRYFGTCLAVVLLTTFLFYAAAAQQDAYTVPPDYPGVRVFIPGIFVPPVPGAPFSGTVEILSNQKLPNGSTYTRWTRYQIARNSTGVIHNERRRLAMPGFRGEPALQQIHIYDPQKHLDTWLDPSTHLARQTALLQLRASSNSTLETFVTPPNSTNLTTMDLGIETVAGVVLHGTRKQRTVPAVRSGTGSDVTVTDDYWYSEDLRVYLVLKHNDPRTGEQTVGIIKLDRSEPDPSIFQIPAAYKVVDETPVKEPANTAQ